MLNSWYLKYIPWRMKNVHKTSWRTQMKDVIKWLSLRCLLMPSHERFRNAFLWFQNRLIYIWDVYNTFSDCVISNKVSDKSFKVSKVLNFADLHLWSLTMTLRLFQGQANCFEWVASVLITDKIQRSKRITFFFL